MECYITRCFHILTFMQYAKKCNISVPTDCISSNSDLKEYLRAATNTFIFTVLLLIEKNHHL